MKPCLLGMLLVMIPVSASTRQTTVLPDVRKEEAHVLVVEPVGTTHTGTAQHERTVARFNRI